MHMTTLVRETRRTRTTPIVVFGALLAAFTVPLSLTGTAVALPSIARDFGDHFGGLAWVVNGYNIAFAVCTVLAGMVADRWGHRRVFLGAAALLIAASAASVLSADVAALVAARTAAGAAAAGLMVTASTILDAVIPDRLRARVFAVLGTAIGAGLALGPAISGFLVAAIGWQGFFGAVGVLAVVFAAALLVVRREVRPGVRGARGGISLAPLRSRRFVAVCLVSIAQAVGFISLLTYLPSALRAAMGLDEVRGGLLTLLMTVPILILPLLVQRFTHRGSDRMERRVLISSLALLVVGDALLIAFRPDMPWGLLVVSLVLLGCAFGLPMGMLDGAAIRSVEAGDAGSAAGLFNLARLGSEALAVGGYAALLTAGVAAVIGEPAAQAAMAGSMQYAEGFAEGFRLVQIVVSLAVLVLSVVIVAVLRGRSRPTGPGASRG